MLAEKLGLDYLDKSLITSVAVRLELSDADVEPHDERPGSFLHRMLTALGSAPLEMAGPPEIAAWSPPYDDPAFDPRTAVLRLTQEVIREAARSESAVIVGRGAAYVLRDHPAALHVFLRASRESKLRALQENYGFEAAAAQRQMKRTDANRAAYIRQVYGHDWAHQAHYDMVLDTGRLGYEAVAESVMAALSRRPV